MTADEMKAYALATFEGVNAVENAGDTFLIFDPDRVLAPQRWMPFATIVTGDHYDTVSDLTARGAYRINMGLTKATYLSLFGPPPKERDERGSCGPAPTTPPWTRSCHTRSTPRSTG